MTINKTMKIFSIAIISACVLLGLLITNLYIASLRSNQAVAQELTLTSLATELSISSADLTKFVRLYAATSKPSAEQAYLDVLAERSGQSPRKATRLVDPGKRAALTDLMLFYGCTTEELAKVAEASKLSNALVALETEAMFAVKGLFKDNLGKYTVQKEPDLAHAVALVFSDGYEEQLVRIQKPLNEFFAMLGERTQKATAKANMVVLIDIILLAITIILLFVLAMLFTYYSRFKICRPLEQTGEYVKEVRQGNFKETPPPITTDEIGALTEGIATMVQKLVLSIEQAEEKTKEAKAAMERAEAAIQETQAAQLAEQNMLVAAKQIENVAEITSLASQQLTQTIEQSKSGAEEQALRINSTVAVVEGMNSSVLEVAHSAETASTISASTREKAENGAHVVQNCITAISSVETSANLLKNDMNTLAIHAQAISQLMGIISDIADQTNLLALNAAIEAARAGDAGRGFAVVADEVRKLAEKTMASTSDVDNAIRAIQQSTETSMKQVDTTVESVAHATKLVESCGQALREIVDLAETTADQVQGIASASEQQSVTSKEITQSIMQVSAIAEDTTHAMHEATTAVTELTQQTQHLNNLVTNLREQ